MTSWYSWLEKDVLPDGEGVLEVQRWLAWEKDIDMTVYMNQVKDQYE